MLLAERLGDWQDGAERVAAAQRALERVRGGCELGVGIMAIAAVVASAAAWIGVPMGRPAAWGGLPPSVYLWALAALAAALGLLLREGGRALTRDSAGGGCLVGWLRGLVAATLPPVVAVLLLVSWAVPLALATDGPWFAPAMGVLWLAGVAAAPLGALWALARYRDVYADADARPRLGRE
jgi:hypothetical protein